jgi:hypothetical protein
VISIDGRTIGSGKPGAMTGRLLEEFRKIRVQQGAKVVYAPQTTATH